MRRVFFILAVLLSFPLHAVNIVSEAKHSACEEIQIYKELKIYKDPTMFVPALSQIYSDPKMGWESLMNESPLLTTVKGTVHLMKLGDPQEFKNFGAIARLYELADQRFIPLPSPTPEPKRRGRLSPKEIAEMKRGPLIIPVKVCGDAYGDSLGFVLASDYKVAQVDEREDGQLRPSTRANPIPKLKKN